MLLLRSEIFLILNLCLIRTGRKSHCKLSCTYRTILSPLHSTKKNPCGFLRYGKATSKHALTKVILSVNFATLIRYTVMLPKCYLIVTAIIFNWVTFGSRAPLGLESVKVYEIHEIFQRL